MLPTFLLAGAAKSGTTTLWNHLQTHSEVCMASIKEPRFFTRQAGDGSQGHQVDQPYPGRYDQGLKWYRGLFATCSNAKARGEASTAYLVAPDSPGLIQATIPEVRLIFILRDPVERLYSNYWQDIKSGFNLPAFDRLVQDAHPSLSRFKANSRYELHLARYLQKFKREQIAIFLFEDLLQNPAKLVQQMYRHIGVRADVLPLDLSRRDNQPRRPRSARLQQLIRTATLWSMRHITHPGLYKALSQVRGNLVQAATRPGDYPVMNPATRRALLPEFVKTQHFVEQELGRSLPGWQSADR